MVAHPDHAAWKRLGQLLEARRVELNPSYRNRTTFAAERGVDYRLAFDIETAARTNYRRPTLRSVEVGYGWRAGSIGRVLEGGEPEPAPQPELVPSRDSHPAPDGLGVQSVLDDPGLTDDEKAGAIALIMRLRERKSGAPPDSRDLTDAELRGELEDLTQRIKELHSQNRLRLGGKANGDTKQQRRA
jgi:hypothetical protein